MWQSFTLLAASNILRRFKHKFFVKTEVDIIFFNILNSYTFTIVFLVQGLVFKKLIPWQVRDHFIVFKVLVPKKGVTNFFNVTFRCFYAYYL